MERKKILVIDNDPDLVTSIADVLKSRPYHVVPHLMETKFRER